MTQSCVTTMAQDEHHGNSIVKTLQMKHYIFPYATNHVISRVTMPMDDIKQWSHTTAKVVNISSQSAYVWEIHSPTPTLSQLLLIAYQLDNQLCYHLSVYSCAVDRHRQWPPAVEQTACTHPQCHWLTSGQTTPWVGPHWTMSWTPQLGQDDPDQSSL